MFRVTSVKILLKTFIKFFVYLSQPFFYNDQIFCHPNHTAQKGSNNIFPAECFCGEKTKQHKQNKSAEFHPSFEYCHFVKLMVFKARVTRKIIESRI